MVELLDRISPETGRIIECSHCPTPTPSPSPTPTPTKWVCNPLHRCRCLHRCWCRCRCRAVWTVLHIIVEPIFYRWRCLCQCRVVWTHHKKCSFSLLLSIYLSGIQMCKKIRIMIIISFCGAYVLFLSSTPQILHRFQIRPSINRRSNRSYRKGQRWKGNCLYPISTIQLFYNR